MTDKLSINFINPLIEKNKKDLIALNEITKTHGLILSPEDIDDLIQGRIKTLNDTERIEFGEGILEKLILAFYDSRYLMQENYAETIYDLQEAFYYFKNESYDTASDDEIIEHMREYFDGYAKGSTEYIIGTSLEAMARFSRNPYEESDDDKQ